jgi:hypothetical protein
LIGFGCGVAIIASRRRLFQPGQRLVGFAAVGRPWGCGLFGIVVGRCGLAAMVVMRRDGAVPCRSTPTRREVPMSLVGTLIALSLLLLAGLGIAGLMLAGRSSRAANDDDPKPRD